MNKIEFKKCFDLYFDDLRSFIYYKCGDKELAGDIAQDVFVKLWENKDNIQSETLKGYLYTIASNLYISKCRHDKVKVRFEKKQKTEMELDSVTPVDEMYFNELNNLLEVSLAEMSESSRTAFLMSRIEGLAYKEIAERLDIGTKAVEKRIGTALSLLKKNLSIYRDGKNE
jgi:RNA polymerase sigma-70 factor (ECF subfamily)